MADKILIIEDEPDISKALEYNLKKEGYDTYTSLNLKDGLAAVYENKISLILLDLMLPDGSGLDLCKKLKSNPEYDFIPIIILTCLLYTSPSPRDMRRSRMPSSA